MGPRLKLRFGPKKNTRIDFTYTPTHHTYYVAGAHAARLDPEQDGSDPRWAAFDDRRTQEVLVAASSYPDLPLWGAFSSLELIVGAASERWGEIGVAFVVKDAAAALTEDDVIGHFHGKVARFKIPHEVRFVDVLPRNATGKVLKRTLREQI